MEKHGQTMYVCVCIPVVSTVRASSGISFFSYFICPYISQHFKMGQQNPLKTLKQIYIYILYLFDISQRLTVVTSPSGTGRLRESWRGTEVQRVGGGDETAARDARCSPAMAIEP